MAATDRQPLTQEELTGLVVRDIYRRLERLALVETLIMCALVVLVVLVLFVR